MAVKKYENSSQGQRSRSNVTNFQGLLAVTTRHSPTTLHQFLACSFRDFTRTDTPTYRRRQKQYLLIACIVHCSYSNCPNAVVEVVNNLRLPLINHNPIITFNPKLTSALTGGIWGQRCPGRLSGGNVPSPFSSSSVDKLGLLTSQGRVTTKLRCGGKYYTNFVANFVPFRAVTVKIL